MNRITVLVAICLTLGFAWDETQAQSDTTSIDTSRIVREEEKAILESLSTPVSMNFVDSPLHEAIQELSKRINREIVIDTRRLNDEGISTDINVHSDLGEISAWQLLHFILKPINLNWVAHDGILEITTQTHADEVFVTRVYEVQSLCELLDPLSKDIPLRHKGEGGLVKRKRGPPPKPAGTFSIPMFPIISGSFDQVAGGTGGGSLRVTDTGIDESAPRAIVAGPRTVEEFLASILFSCSSLKWQQIDGDGGTIQSGAGRLVISQAYQGHFEIAGILHALEHIVRANVPGQSITARRNWYPRREDAAIFGMLSRPITIEIPKGSLQVTFRGISEQLGIPVWFDLDALSDEGISTDQEVAPVGSMQKLPLGTCLQKILDPIYLTFVVEEGVLVVTTITRAEETQITCFYDVSRIPTIGTPDPIAIDHDDRYSRIIRTVQEVTHDRWEEHWPEGVALFVSSKHLAIRQSQKVQREIALLLDDLKSDKPIVPEEPSLEIRVYAAPDLETARDLVQVLPKTLEQKWDQKGSINQAGRSLLVKQSTEAHEMIALIMNEIMKSQLPGKPAAVVPAVKPPTAEISPPPAAAIEKPK